MPSCWTVCFFLVFMLGSFCFWNCMHRDDSKDISSWHGCVDQMGNPTDFFILYKLPEDKDSDSEFIQNGEGYMYLTPDGSSRLQTGGVSSVLSFSDSASNWVFSNVSISSDMSMPGRTLHRLYKEQGFEQDSIYVIYNDEFPNGTTTMTHGHTKGVLVLSDKGGYWLVHSVPKYPPERTSDYSYPHTGKRYGQSMLCISLPQITRDLVESLGGQLLQNDVHIYDWGIPKDYLQQYPILTKVIKGEHPQHGPFYRFAELASVEGKTFTSFAKYKKFDKDLYSGFVAPLLKTNLFVESWRNGPQPLPPSCNTTFHVQNVQEVETKAASMEFSTHKDHSKWAVAESADRPYVCIGDINRMVGIELAYRQKTQFQRGGGTVCLWSLSIWHRFRELVKESDVCPLKTGGMYG